MTTRTSTSTFGHGCHCLCFFGGHTIDFPQPIAIGLQNVQPEQLTIRVNLMSHSLESGDKSRAAHGYTKMTRRYAINTDGQPSSLLPYEHREKIH